MKALTTPLLRAPLLLRALAILTLVMGPQMGFMAGPVAAQVTLGGSLDPAPVEAVPEPAPETGSEAFPTGAADPMVPVAPDPVTSVAPVVIVNGAAISDYEIDQRAAFLAALQQSGDVRNLAFDALVLERAQSVAAAQLGVSVTPEQIRAGMEEFAARAQLTPEVFVAELAKAGVAPETFRDFVKAGLIWRGATRAKFAGRVAVSEAEVDRALGMGASAGEGRRVLLSELVIPKDEARDVMALAQRVRLAVKTQKDFALMARQFSRAATASGGGELGWLDEDKLPPEIRGALAGLQPGEMTQVLALGSGAALYFLRDEGAVAGDATSGASVVDYAVLAGGTGDLAARLLGCDGLYAPARKGGALVRATAPEAGLPADLRAAVSGLDSGEARVLADGRILVLCSRIRASGLPAARDAVRTDILNRKVGLLAEAWAEELRFNAYIETP
ncbi:peptidylprolyl isomerase [Rhodobacter sp. KR11]|uniref:peptidylprolyl isomerase n=1 Tax=Rhodobacter sp. KR11 TaxID=2974588 RepID=UPI0022222932|nr:peptidylprolyl isomerase [Rhodobacter sp. KR11]MCW1919549.1 peptidylprolyl isomerase [Rhodobacter sp. KR11]